MKKGTPALPRKSVTKSALVAIAVLMVAAGPMHMFAPTMVSADEYDEQIKALEKEVEGFNAQAQKLAQQADTLASAVAKLQNEQAQIQTEIELNNTKAKDLAAKITENQKKLEDQEKVLSDTLVDMYLDGKTTPIEVLAGSKSLGDYVDSQSQRATVRDQVSYSTKHIKVLKKQLEDQKAEVDQIIKDQTARKADLAAKQGQQAALLAETQGQEANYKNLSSQRNSQIGKLRDEQRAANAARAAQYGGGSAIAGDPSKGGYPASLDNAPMDTLVDPWGMYNRECVSYTAWKVQQTYGNMPYWGGRGNANEWPSSARASGIPTGSTPKVGSVGVMYIGYYGHVVWIEQVSGNKVYVSQYNWEVTGHYSEMWIDAGAIDTYIYFGDR